MILGFLFFAGLLDFAGAPLWTSLSLGVLLDLAVCGIRFRREIRIFLLRAARRRRGARVWRIPERSARGARLYGR